MLLPEVKGKKERCHLTAAFLPPLSSHPQCKLDLILFQNKSHEAGIQTCFEKPPGKMFSV